MTKRRREWRLYLTVYGILLVLGLAEFCLLVAIRNMT
jgi:hypothetical protein